MYKIGIYKAGQQIAKEVFASENLEEVKAEFCRMWNATEFDPDGIDNQSDSAEDAWNERKHFSEDTNNVSVFDIQNGDLLRTEWTYTGWKSNILN